MLPSKRVASVICVLLVLASGCTADGSKPSADGSEQPSTSPCASTVTTDALPEWARTGFRGNGAGVPHVFSEHGDLIAVLFNYPPVASADHSVANKILWVSRVPQQPMQPLRIEAARNGAKSSVLREIAGGPGPSTLNLPRAGCWHLALSWSGHTDGMTLTFS